MASTRLVDGIGLFPSSTIGLRQPGQLGPVGELSHWVSFLVATVKPGPLIHDPQRTDSPKKAEQAGRFRIPLKGGNAPTRTGAASRGRPVSFVTFLTSYGLASCCFLPDWPRLGGALSLDLPPDLGL